MTNHTSDADLVAGHLAGDPAALAGIYDRYADSLHDTAAAMLNDRSEAADVLQDVILVAAQRLEQLRDPERLKPWLFAILRNEVYLRTKKRRRTIVTDFSEAEGSSGGIDMADPRIGDPGDDAVDDVSGAELAALVRNAARGLDERDQLVLELSMRQGLGGQDLADALGVSANQSYTLVHRMRERIEKSLGAFVVARTGRGDCDDLERVLATWDGEFSVLVRKRVARHIESCDTCDRRRRTAVPFAMFAAAPVYAAPPALRDRVLAAADTASVASVPSYRFIESNGFPTVTRASRRVGAWVAPAAAAAVLLVAGAAVVFVAVAGSDDDVFTARGAPSTTVEPVTGAPAPDTTLADRNVAEGAEESVDDPPSTTTATPRPSVTPSTTLAPSPAGSVPVEVTTTAPSAADTTSVAATTPAGPTTAPPAPVTVPPTPAPPTVAAPTTPATTTSPTTAPPSTPAPTAGRVVVSGNSIALGPDSANGSVTVSNPGDIPVDFAVTGSTGAYSVAPLQGTLAGGTSIDIVAGVDRSGLPEGDVPGTTLLIGGAGSSEPLVISAQVERPPVVSGVDAGGFCSTDVVSIFVSAQISDESPVSATFSVTGPTGQSGSDTMGPDGDAWFGAVDFSYSPNEPAAVAGTWAWTITASDARGNSSTTSGSTGAC